MLHHLSRTTCVFLVLVFVLFNSFAFLRALPVNSRLPENREPQRGNYNRNVYRILKLANNQASRPFLEIKNHALFFDRNPGLFMFAAELFVRGGATTPFPNQVLAIALWNIGLVLLFLWLLQLFRSELAAAAGLGFVVLTPYLLFYSSSIHHDSWCFCFFNLTFYCFMRYLKQGQTRSWLVATCVAYFFLCQSYWFYYMSAGILLVGLQIHEQKFSLCDTAILALVPVLATLTTFLQVVYARDGIDAALFRMKDIAAARSLDMRIENSDWFPDKKFVQPHHIDRYPLIVRDRIELMSGVSVSTLAAMTFASVVLAGRAWWRRLLFVAIVIFAGVCWHIVMIQHTVIHRFAGMYGWFMWVLIVALFARELARALSPPRATSAVIALALPLAASLLSRDYLPYLQTYWQNARAEEARTPAPPEPKKPGKSKTRSDTLSEDDMKE